MKTKMNNKLRQQLINKLKSRYLSKSDDVLDTIINNHILPLLNSCGYIIIPPPSKSESCKLEIFSPPPVRAASSNKGCPHILLGPGGDFTKEITLK